jgi:hypothetical protein
MEIGKVGHVRAWTRLVAKRFGRKLFASESYMTEILHRTVEGNGIRIHLAEQGEGPLVLLCHWPSEGWYPWRHQLKALAEASLHAVAPNTCLLVE